MTRTSRRSVLSSLVAVGFGMAIGGDRRHVLTRSAHASVPACDAADPGIWRRGVDLPEGGIGSLSRLTDGAVLAVSGDHASLFDPTTEIFTPVGQAPRDRGRHRAVRLLDGRLFLLSEDGRTDLYDPVTAAWHLGPSRVATSRAFSITLLADGRVLVVGGATRAAGMSERPVARAETYDPSTERWQLMAPLLSARLDHTATRLSDGRVLVVGGGYGVPRPAGVVIAEVYDPAADAWRPTRTQPSQREWHTATRLRDGRVFIVGGGTRLASEVLAPLLFDETEETYWAAAMMRGGRRLLHTATLLPSGRVLVAGGSSLVFAERYDPNDDTWTEVGTSETIRPPDEEIGIRNDASTAVLGDGRVLLAGGWSPAGRPPRVTPRSTWLYESCTEAHAAAALPEE